MTRTKNKIEYDDRSLRAVFLYLCAIDCTKLNNFTTPRGRYFYT
nr:MAG TPA: hypothetical protein [Caudoviricetes sp.]